MVNDSIVEAVAAPIQPQKETPKSDKVPSGEKEGPASYTDEIKKRKEKAAKEEKERKEREAKAKLEKERLEEEERNREIQMAEEKLLRLQETKGTKTVASSALPPKQSSIATKSVQPEEDEEEVVEEGKDKKQSNKLVGPTKAAVTGRRAPSTKNPIRARAELAQKAEEQAKTRTQVAPSTSAARSVQMGGYGLLYAVGADAYLFKKSATRSSNQAVSDMRLIQIKGRRHCFVRRVELSCGSLNNGDVFLLDTGKNNGNIIYQWNGPDANRIEKGKGMDVAKSIKDKERSGVPKVVVLEAGADDSNFWECLGGKGSIASTEDSGADDLQAEKSLWDKVKLYQVCQPQENQFELVEMASGKLLKEMLQETECYIVDSVPTCTLPHSPHTGH